MKTRVYLSRKMGGRSGREVLAEGRELTTLCEEFGLEPYDPAHSENIPDTDEPISLSVDFNTMKLYVAKDSHALSTCDVYLGCTGDTPSDGAWDEKGQAMYLHKMPVVLIAPKRARGDLMGFANITSNAVFATAREAIQFIAEHYATVKRG